MTAPLCVLIALVAVAALWIACESDDDSGAGLDKYFLRDVAAMQAMGLPVYWLGTEFAADGSIFRGPYGAEFGAEVEGGGIDMDYLASVDGGSTVFELTVYSRNAWARGDHHVNNPGVPGVARRAVTVGDREGELVSVPSGTRPVNTLWLVLDLGDVVVLATALAGGAVSPGGPDYSPFINNPDLLIQVMDGLRPYPE